METYLNLPVVCSITATCGRHKLLERVVSMLLNQDYKGRYILLVYNNSDIPLILDPGIKNTNIEVKLINNYTDSKTGKPYTSLGAIYNDILSHIPKDVDIVTHSDDDDLFLEDHISRGVEGYIRGTELNMNCRAYKPQQSYFRHPSGIARMGNTLEPSIFVDFSFLLNMGYSLTTTDQHLQWYYPLGNDIFIDPEGKPTLIYNWGDDIPTFKTSGDCSNPNNFNNYRNFSNDHGDQIITPHDVSEYYKLINETVK